MKLRSRLFLLRLWIRKYLAARKQPVRDLEAEQIEDIKSQIDRLEVVAALGGMAAIARLHDMAEDRVGQGRRQMAQAALARVQSHEPLDLREYKNG